MDIEYVGNFPCLFIQNKETVLKMLDHLSQKQVVQRLSDEPVGMFEHELTDGFVIPSDTIANLVYFHLMEMMGGKYRLTQLGQELTSLAYGLGPYQSIRVQQYFNEHPRVPQLSKLAYNISVEE